MTPAMKAGVTDRLWEIGDILNLLKQNWTAGYLSQYQSFKKIYKKSVVGGESKMGKKWNENQIFLSQDYKSRMA